MRIQVSGERGEGKTTLINLLEKVLGDAGYLVIKPGSANPALKDVKTKVVIIEEIF